MWERMEDLLCCWTPTLEWPSLARKAGASITYLLLSGKNLTFIVTFGIDVH